MFHHRYYPVRNILNYKDNNGHPLFLLYLRNYQRTFRNARDHYSIFRNVRKQTCVLNIGGRTTPITVDNDNTTSSQRWRNGWRPFYQPLHFSSRRIELSSLPIKPSTPSSQEQPHFNNDRRFNLFNSTWGIIISIGCTISGILLWKSFPPDEDSRFIAHASMMPPPELKLSEQVIPNLPTFTSHDVAKHYNSETKIWVTFHRGVYDITDFVSKHPGGDRIMMAAGGSLLPFWELYPVHQRPDIYAILETHRIGNLAFEDQVKLDDSDRDHFSQEPKRHPALIIRAQKPFNGETPPVLLPQQLYTTNELFYVRNHLPVPVVNPNTYELEICGFQLLTSRTFSLAELKCFPRHEISATIQCGGNRRSEMSIVQPVAGLSWTGGAIGNAKWSGVRLKDVMKASGFDATQYKDTHRLHIQFEGLDSDVSGESYGASIPFSYMLDDNFQPILAFEMNDRELSRDHGFPVRLILPGIVGARNVKWLSRIIVSEEESQSPWQQRDYKVFSPSVTMNTVDFSTAPAIQDTPVTSYICSHKTGEMVKRDEIEVQGYAFSGGGRHIVRVELSVDQGKTWKVTNLTTDEALHANHGMNWAWTLWKLTIDLNEYSKEAKEVELWVKAVDSGYNQQSENFQSIYNYRGLLSNAYHKVKLQFC